ncbi:uncharacterized protein LOC135218610 isoform X1 [Macrobrachium nipponense]|uniref:uncharacterized protein LOC135218610 isoform X1 n=1 Tax=Macrobrachium nipponense TaxID=159736 RepID=UPI0030C87E12
MNRNANKSLKRKVIEYQDGEIDEDGRASKEAKRDTSNSSISSSFSTLALRRLVPEDWNPSPISRKQDEENEDSFEKTGDRTVDRGTLWSGKDVCQEPQGISQLYMACNRSVKKSSSCDCETQTYYFVPNSHDTRNEVSKDKGLVRECCVIGCKYNSEEDSSVSYYGLPSSKAERSLWADTLGLKFASASKGEIQEICSRHFDASISPQSSLPKVSHTPKSKTRKKKTCDILIAEEAEKVKQSMATGRAKRTPKPNRNYDWAELMPLIKSETEDYEMEAAMSKNPGKRRKQLLDYIKKGKKGNERSFMEMHVNLDDEVEESDSESDEYDVGNISLPSLPRPPPPKGKGRPHRIQDTCTQTESSLNSRGPLREVKVQCNLTAEPLVSCSSCSSIDWRSLDEELSQIMSVIECEIVNPILSRCLSNALSEHAIPSHAANVLKMIAGLPRDYLEDRKDIHIVPGEDEFDEVEIEKFIHQEEGPIVGIREIIAKDWNKKAKTVRTTASKRDEDILDDPDSFGLKEATDKDDDEFNPEGAAVEEDDDDYEEDDDWDIKKDDSGASIQKKKTRLKAKKEHTLKAGSEQGSSQAVEKKKEGTVMVSGTSNKTKIQQNRRRRRKAGDTRWIRKEHRCTDCNIVFSTQRKYNLHYSHVHLGVAPWQGHHKCDDCGKVFTQKVTLKVHRMFKHGAPRRFRCTKCVYEGPTKEYLKRHMKVHSNERHYVCSACGKGLKTLDSYRNHMVLHTNEGRFFCTLCKKAFNHKGAYTDHMHCHEESRNYACYCGASFKVYKHVARHIRAVHLNDKRFICDICGTQHMTGFNLKNHLKKHGDVPYLPYSYECSTCEAKFRGHQGLATHLRVIHNSKIVNISPEEIKPTEPVHPTRRPTKYRYSLLSDDSTVMSNDSAAEDNRKLLVACEEGYILSEIKAEEGEEVVYNVSAREVDLNQEVDYEFVSGNDEREVIHIFSCNICSSMFSSESLCQEHMAKVHLSE